MDEMLSTTQVKALALEAGFLAAGVAAAQDLSAHAGPLEGWLREGLCGSMDYMRRNLPQRKDPRLLVDGARSVIVLAAGYQFAQDLADAPGTALKADAMISRYARGRDYHKVLKRRCIDLMDHVRGLAPSFEGRAFVDSAPIMERTLAVLAGVGWVGRNGCLVVPGTGSYVMLCEIVCNLPLVPDTPLVGDCGDCDACVRACPSGALLGDKRLDAWRCISCLTIEHEGQIDAEFREHMGLSVFGCDRCQEVCPHNQAGASSVERGQDADTISRLGAMLAWTPQDWDRHTAGKAWRRASYVQWMRNVIIAAGNCRCEALAGDLDRAREQLADFPELAELLSWARQRVGDAHLL